MWKIVGNAIPSILVNLCSRKHTPMHVQVKVCLTSPSKWRKPPVTPGCKMSHTLPLYSSFNGVHLITVGTPGSAINEEYLRKRMLGHRTQRENIKLVSTVNEDKADVCEISSPIPQDAWERHHGEILPIAWRVIYIHLRPEGEVTA